MAPIDLDAYARRIGVAVPLAPDLDTLTSLVERHAATIPFENIDVLARRVPALDAASLERKLVHGGRGGYCFEQNALFLACLHSLGFDAHALEARVRNGVPADVTTGRTHMAVRVRIDGADWLVDVGFGGLAPTAPLRLGARDVQRDAYGAAYRLVELDGDRLLQCETHEGWQDCYRIVASRPQPIDFDLANWWVATNPVAFLGKNLLVALSLPHERRTLFNATLSVRTAPTARPSERWIGARAEMADVLADGFGIELDGVALDAVMAALERQGG